MVRMLVKHLHYFVNTSPAKDVPRTMIVSQWTDFRRYVAVRTTCVLFHLPVSLLSVCVNDKYCCIRILFDVVWLTFPEPLDVTPGSAKETC